MQEIHSIGNGMLFCGGGGGDRRLRLHLHLHHHNQNQQQQHHQHQALKCPRCDSFNTKFCYYNNYNLSQPRHFCKNCRRYWTKGGVLRNVPVGGASRKSKHPNNNNKSSSSASVTAPATTTPPPPDRNEINSHSSSESSATTVAATEAVSAPVVSNAFSVNPALELEQVSVFSETGSLTTNDALPFWFGNNNHVLEASSFRFGVTRQLHENDQLQVVTGNGTLGQCHEEFATASFLDRAVPLEFFSSLQNKAAHGGGFGPLDQSMFDLPNTVDQPYWAHGHWSGHHNPTLFHHFP